MSFFRNLLVPHKIKRTLDSRIVLVSIFLLSVPQRHKVKYNCDNKDDYKSKPGKEGNTEVENIFDAFQNMSKKAKMFLGVMLLYGSTKKHAYLSKPESEGQSPALPASFPSNFSFLHHLP